MKHIFFTALLSSCLLICAAQQSDVFKYNAAENTQEDLVTRMLKYPQFTKGKAFFANGTVTEALFNYHYDTNQILFINAKNDTLELAEPELYQQIVIDSDTFLYTKQGFLQLVSATPVCKLLVKRNLILIGSEKKSAYGGYSATSSSTALNSYPDGTMHRIINTDENYVYRYRDSYFFTDRFQNIYLANKKGARDLGWKKEKEVKSFIEKANINFEKKEDIMKLVSFFQTIGIE